MYGIRQILDIQKSKIQEECNEYYNKYKGIVDMSNYMKQLKPNNKPVTLSESFSKDIKDIDRAVEEIDKALRVKELKCISSQLIQARTMLLRQKEKICRILKRLDE